MKGITFTEYEKGFRDEISSEDLNRNFEDIFNDISDAYTRTSYINTKLRQYVSDISFENQVLAARVAELEDAVGDSALASGVAFWSAYSDDEIISNTGLLDTTVGNLTLDWNKGWSKLQLVTNEYGDLVLGTASKIAFDDGIDPEAYLERPDTIFNAFDNNPSTKWTKTYPTGSAPAYVDVRLQLPSSMNPSINSMYISPFPDGGPEIEHIYYLTSAGTWVEVGAAITKRTRLHFTPSDYANQIKMRVLGTELLDSLGAPVTLFGLEDVDVNFIEYDESSVTVVEMDAGSTITTLTTITMEYTITPSVNENISHPVILELYEDSGLTTKCYSSVEDGHPYTGAIDLATPSQKVYAKITLAKINNTTPIVRSLKLNYV